MDEIVNSKHLEAITNILRETGERIEGNLICDIAPDNWIYNHTIDKIKNLQYLCKGKKRIIEIGVNGCHSLLIMLLINPSAEYLLFDLNNHRYTEPALNYIKTSFPNTTINVVFGNSVTTVKKYCQENMHAEPFDMCHLDGGHTEDVFSHDYANVKDLVKNGTIIFDDYDYPEIRGFINKKLESGEISKYIDTNIIDTNLHFVYHYN
jgi:hypothetical protein